MMATRVTKDNRVIASKLHRQFAHPTPERLIKIIRNSGNNNKDLEKEVNNISQKCITCIKFKKKNPRPVVCMPMANEFNEIIAIDLKIWGNHFFLVIVDLATRFCTASVISNKLPSTIIKNLFVSWITIFGAPKRILSDNGGEFDNPEMRALGEAFNITIKTTAAESPWSNGICERLNGVLGTLVNKILDDVNCNIQMALAWAVSARNAYDNNSGYSPNQLVFGFNPAIPNIYNSNLPGLENVTSSEIVRRNLNALHVARQEFVKFESDERIKRALRHNVRNTCIDSLENGDEVYYKRNDENEWRGPGIVIGRDGKTVIVKHGGRVVKVHVVSLVKMPKENNNENDNQSVENLPEMTRESSPESDNNVPSVGGRESNNMDTITKNPAEIVAKRKISKARGFDDSVSSACGRASSTIDTIMKDSTEMVSKKRKVFEENPKINWKNGQRFQGIDRITGEYVSGKILNRAGKVKGINKNCYNVKKDKDGWQGWFNMESLRDISVVDKETELIILFNSNAVAIAKEKEIQNWIDNDVFDEVEDRRQKAISVRWVVTEKVREGNTVTKARLVARGFEENTTDLPKDSPTVSREAIRFLIFFAAFYKWDCHTLDVKSAYLQGDNIKRVIYLRPPPEFNNGNLWKLKKTVYGLCDAARAWYIRVKNELINLSVQMCGLDNSLFMWHRNGKLEGIICIYVDDFLWSGTENFEKQVINKLKEKFLIGSSASITFTYVGLSIKSYSDGITIDQTQYISSLNTIPVSKDRISQKKSQLLESEIVAYRALVGQLNWVATHTRPDIAFETCELSVSLKKGTMTDLIRLNKLVERVKKESINLFFPQLKCLRKCTLECFTDASFRNLPNEESQGGLIIFLRDETGKRCPIFWQSRKIDRVVNSTLAAETMALVEGAGTAVYMAGIIKELIGNVNIRILCYTDNKSLVESLYSSKQVNDRRLRLDVNVIENMLARGEISRVIWVNSKDQLADCLTKRGVCTDNLKEIISRN